MCVEKQPIKGRVQLMHLKSSLKYIVFGLLVIVLAACSNSETMEDASVKSDETKKLEGNVVIDGSGTVYPLMDKLAKEYMKNEQLEVTVEVSRSGTTAGFEKFLVENGTNFNDASREIKEEEIDKAEQLGIEFKELKVALDGLTFVIHPENDWATEMTKEELIDIFLGNIQNWSDINSDWPNEKINTYGPNENHGTYEFFFENVLEEQTLSAEVDLLQEYPTLVENITDDINGIAFFGFGYYLHNKDKLRAVKVDFGKGPVEPALDTIAEDGAYADFTRPVFTYLNINHAKEKPQVLDFAKYVLTNMNEFAGEVGFAPIPQNEVDENLQFLSSLE